MMFMLAVSEVWRAFEMLNSILWNMVEDLSAFFLAKPVATLLLVIILLAWRRRKSH